MCPMSSAGTASLRSPDRRKHRRHPLSTTIQFYHAPSQREIPARSIDISTGGMLMYVPAATPAQPGQPICLSIGGGDRPEFAVNGEEPIDATIVRVNRHALLRTGYLAIGVKFAHA